MLLRRHWHIEDGPECVLCPTQHLESRDHLFFQCNFSVRIWNYLQIEWNGGSNMVDIAQAARRGIQQPFFLEVVFVAWWNIWAIRNAKVFHHERPNFARWKAGFVHDLTLLGYRIKHKFKDDFFRWI